MYPERNLTSTHYVVPFRMTISVAESKSLSWIRVVAMLSIVICHLFQAYQGRWSDVFNMGVQVFFVLSGFLYGHKLITNWRDWAKSRIRRVYQPYLLFLITVIPLYALFHEEAMNWKALPVYFLNLQGFRLLPKLDFLRIEGLRHVWFITAIMCAYLSTPFLQRLRACSGIMMPTLLLLIAASYCLMPSYRYVFVLSWVYLYAIGYFFANLDSRWQLFYLLLFLFALTILTVLMKWEDFRHPWSASYRLVHDLVGVVFVVGGVKVLSLVKGLEVPQVIRFLDKYSFPVYMVHFIIMHGPFSMAYVTPFRWISIVLMLVTTSVAVFAFVSANNALERIWIPKNR